VALTDLSSDQLSRLIQLVNEKETLQAELLQVNRALESFGEGDTSPENKAGKINRPVRVRRRVALQDTLLKSLEAVGKEGLTVKELAEKLGANPLSVSGWFYTTGKRIKGIKKVGKAKFAYVTR
jgi:hypothetical protein